MNKFDIGQEVWTSGYSRREKQKTCPDCFGKKFLTVILGDDSRVYIDCAGCSRGYESPCGYVTDYEYGERVEPRTITGMEINEEHGDQVIRYKFSCYTFESDLVFATREEAQEKSIELGKAQKLDDEKRMLTQKENRQRTWSWNATYHRSEIKRLEKDLAYHKEKLNVAASKLVTESA